jgi:hypothetical protein
MMHFINFRDLTGSTWISHNDLSKKFNTKIDEFNVIIMQLQQ